MKNDLNELKLGFAILLIISLYGCDFIKGINREGHSVRHAVPSATPRAAQ